MYKYSFLNDYSEGAHPRILEALTRTNFIQEPGYGEDQFCLEAAELIRMALGTQTSDIHFVSGGTQANSIFLSSVLRPYESVIAVHTGHICVHETGAIEATGHKINSVKGHDGKITVAEIEEVVASHNDEHMVKPRVVYISHSTELGTIYSAREIREISAICNKLNLLFYLDGARLASAITARPSDLDLKELSSYVDAFYIGGTKNGALLGEALIINNPLLKPGFRHVIKQRGGLLSKGRLIGIQFLELFKDDLYLNLARNANEKAQRIVEGMLSLGYSFQTESPTNQIFPILPNSIIQKMNQVYRFYSWSKVDQDNSSIRLVTSWATSDKAVEEFLTDLKSCARPK